MKKPRRRVVNFVIKHENPQATRIENYHEPLQSKPRDDKRMQPTSIKTPQMIEQLEDKKAVTSVDTATATSQVTKVPIQNDVPDQMADIKPEHIVKPIVSALQVENQKTKESIDPNSAFEKSSTNPIVVKPSRSEMYGEL